MVESLLLTFSSTAIIISLVFSYLKSLKHALLVCYFFSAKTLANLTAITTGRPENCLPIFEKSN